MKKRFKIFRCTPQPVDHTLKTEKRFKIFTQKNPRGSWVPGFLGSWGQKTKTKTQTHTEDHNLIHTMVRMCLLIWGSQVYVSHNLMQYLIMRANLAHTCDAMPSLASLRERGMLRELLEKYHETRTWTGHSLRVCGMFSDAQADSRDLSADTCARHECEGCEGCTFWDAHRTEFHAEIKHMFTQAQHRCTQTIERRQRWRQRKHALWMTSEHATHNVLQRIPQDVARWIISNFL